MQIDQTDIAGLSDDELKLLVLAVLDTTAAENAPGLNGFWLRLAAALIGAKRERVASLAALEFDAMNDDAPGGIVGLGEDPVSEALGVLRGGCRGQGLE